MLWKKSVSFDIYITYVVFHKLLILSQTQFLIYKTDIQYLLFRIALRLRGAEYKMPSLHKCCIIIQPKIYHSLGIHIYKLNMEWK